MNTRTYVLATSILGLLSLMTPQAIVLAQTSDVNKADALF